MDSALLPAAPRDLGLRTLIMFTQQNTDGYTDEQLAQLNRRLPLAVYQLIDTSPLLTDDTLFAEIRQAAMERLLREFDTELAGGSGDRDE